MNIMEKFDTFEDAEKHLEIRKKRAYDNIKKRGDKVLSDNSVVIGDFFGEGKFIAFLSIITKDMLEDIKNFKQIDVQAEEEKLLNELEK